MRIIAKLADETGAHRFSAFLKRQNIENHVDVQRDLAVGCLPAYQIWVTDEDKIPEANDYLQRFNANPADPLFDEPIFDMASRGEEALPEAPTRRHYAPVTSFFLALCVFVFLLNWIQESSEREEGLSEQTVLLTPVQTSLLFDLPPAVEKFEAFVEKHEIPPTQKLKDMSPDLRQELESLQKTPYWQGIYDWLLLKIKTGDPSASVGPLFIKIREGQIWRLFSPCILHRDLLHILFNMIWLWVLSRPIEQRIGAIKTLLLTLIVAVFSNTLQYLMSGPLFLGYSGVVMGLAGFIWMRERQAPWEGYPLQRGTILFLGFYVAAMFVLQTMSFFVQIFSDLPFILSIANTAHIAGGAIGALLGRLSYFARN